MGYILTGLRWIRLVTSHRRVPTAGPFTLINCYVILRVNQPWVSDDVTNGKDANVSYCCVCGPGIDSNVKQNILLCFLFVVDVFLKCLANVMQLLFLLILPNTMIQNHEVSTK